MMPAPRPRSTGSGGVDAADAHTEGWRHTATVPSPVSDRGSREKEGGNLLFVVVVVGPCIVCDVVCCSEKQKSASRRTAPAVTFVTLRGPQPAARVQNAFPWDHFS